MTVTHKHLDSSYALSEWAASLGVGTDRSLGYYTGRDDLDPFEGAKQGVRLLKTGDDTFVEEARKLLQEFSEGIVSPHFTWEHNMVGAFPDVPAYLSGDPENMWFKANNPSDRTPLRIYVGIGCSWSITPDQLRQRGIVLAALAMALSEVRPIYITPFANSYDYSGTNHGMFSWDISTSPLVLSELLAVMSDVRIVRYVWIPLIKKFFPPTAAGVPFVDIRRQHIPNIRDEDLYIAPISSRDPLLDDPITWLKTNVAKYGQQNDD